MTCKCASHRIIKVYAHSRDCNSFVYDSHEYEGYVPSGIGVGGGDDIQFEFCADCGQIQYFKPITDSQIFKAFGISENNEDDMD